jgi:hypothetical protein
MAMPWWFVVFCLLFPVQVGLLMATQRNLTKTGRALTTLRREAAALNERTAWISYELGALERTAVLMLALWRISWGRR